MDSVPSYLKRRMILTAILPGAAGALTTLPPFVWHRSYFAVTFPAYVVFLSLLMVFTIRWRTRFKKHLKESQCLLCWECGYDLSRLDVEGNCPECGKHFVAPQLQLRWLDAGFCTIQDWETPQHAELTDARPPEAHP